MSVIRTVKDVIMTPNYIVGYEQRDDTTYVHCMVRKWNAQIARQFRLDIDLAQALLGKTVYALDDPDNPTLRKFLKLHGFVPLTRQLDIFGRNVEVFERPLKWAAVAALARTQSRTLLLGPTKHPT